MFNRGALQVCTALLLTLPTSSVAHEMWVLTDDMVKVWGDKSFPATYTSFTIPTVLTLVIALGINSVLVRLNRSGANELFPLYRARMRSMRPYTALVLRFSLAWVLLSSALAMEPRFGNVIGGDPTLLAPDILIGDLPVHWQWLRWLQLVIGVVLIAGVYVRLAAAACLLLVCFSLFLVGMAAMAYAPVYTGVALYLLVAGPGSHYVPLPVSAIINSYCQKMKQNVSVSRAQYILRVLTGFNFLFLAVCFKVLQPNLTLAIIEIHHLPTMGLSPEVFVLIIAVTEVSIALLILFGILVRFVSVALIVAFTFFAICLSNAENITSHMLYYGVAISFLFNGNGQWRQRQATDIKSSIVILGNSISAVSAARYLERILPNPSNVEVTLLSERTDVQFKNMLPEVVSGAVQPNSLINSLTKILSRTHLVLANTRSINTVENTVTYTIPGGEEKSIQYDQLIVANDPVTDRDCESHINYQGIEHMENVVDALKLKQTLLRCLFTNRYSLDEQKTQQINIAIYGGGEPGSALAMEIYSFIQTLKNDRCFPRGIVINTLLFENNAEQKKMSATILALRKKHFERRNIKVISADIVSSLSSHSLELYDGVKVDMDIVVNLSTREVLPRLSGIASLPGPVRTENLTLSSCNNIWMASCDELLKKNPEKRISLRLEQSRLAALNAWAVSQRLEPVKLKKVRRSLYEFYMGRHSIAAWKSVAMPGALGLFLNRRRYLSALPSMERKLRIIMDWSLDFVFNNDTAGFLEHDYNEPDLRIQHVSERSPGFA